MKSSLGLGLLIGACVVAAIVLTAPVWVVFGSIIYAVLSVLF